MIKGIDDTAPAPAVDEKQITYWEATNIIKELSGKIFTQLDACITNDRQLKSIKDCIRNDITYSFSQLYQICEPDYKEKIPIVGWGITEDGVQEHKVV